MNTNTCTCFLPVRSGSQRVKNKNIKKISSYKLGLFEIKFKQLLRSKRINKIIVSTNEKKITTFLSNNKFKKKVILDIRPEYYCSNKISTDKLIEYSKSILPQEDILWTHVTSPFINEKNYDAIIDFYFNKMPKKNDSLLTTHVIKNYLWMNNKPLNYNLLKEKWPPTQSIKPIYELDSGAFICHKKIYEKYDNRIGMRPYFFQLDKLTSTDVDWEQDFQFVKSVIKLGIKKI